ncbi:MAG TPA: (4Fe-4S)-binding protein, partial [Aliiroseovarius sp.]|nr:(4Fe-4S)-binding protein [Aliiroseovarius sp.]
AARAPDLPEPLDRPIAARGSRRQVARMAARALHGLPDAPPPAPIALPMGAPYGAVEVNTDACTLCLSCVSLCPSGALMDNPDSPELKFQEDACLQCGICARACPESAITLVPRLDLSDAALGQHVLHREDPFACISCGTPFGVKSSIEHILNTLAGKHPAFASSAQAQLIQMCDSCRVEAQFHSETNPFQSAPAPRPRMAGDAPGTPDTPAGNGTRRRDH